MNMKLETLLKHVTLPIHPELDPETDRPRLGSTGYAIYRDSEVIADGIQTPELAQYLCHTATVLPELVAAMKHLQQNWEKNLTEPMAKLNQALDRAESVYQGTAKKTPNQRSIPHANGTHKRPHPDGRQEGVQEALALLLHFHDQQFEAVFTDGQ